MTIAGILQQKKGDVIHVAVSDKILATIQLLAEKRIGCVPVVDDGKVVGVFSERDVVYLIAKDGAEALQRTVGEVMTSPAITVKSDMPVIQGLSLMTKRRIRHLPVISDEGLIGLVSIGDLVKFRIDKIEAEAAALKDYIQSA